MSKTAEKHKLDGTFRGDRHSDDIKAPMMADLPPAPVGMEGFAAEWWRKTVIDLNQMGILYRSDLALLAAYCNLLADMDRAREDMDECRQGMKDAEDIAVRVAWGKSYAISGRMYNEAFKLAYAAGKEFGLSPLARTKIKLALPDEKDDFDKV